MPVTWSSVEQLNPSLTAAHPIPEIEQQTGSLSCLNVACPPVLLAVLITGPTSQVLETWLLEAVGIGGVWRRQDY